MPAATLCHFGIKSNTEYNITQILQAEFKNRFLENICGKTLKIVDLLQNFVINISFSLRVRKTKNNMRFSVRFCQSAKNLINMNQIKRSLTESALLGEKKNTF